MTNTLPRRLASNSTVGHYENFPVASVLCPRRIRPAVLALYHFARTADDLADEGDASLAQRSADLQTYRQELTAVIEGQLSSARWSPIFDPLRLAITQYQLPVHALHALLDAFELDVQRTASGWRYQTRQQLLGYCALSANPVGRLLLHLVLHVPSELDAQPALREQALEHSDAICSALQLINFWQDGAIDQAGGRFYWPAEPLSDLLAWSRQLMQQGMPLVHSPLLAWHKGFAWELRLVIQGGLRILDKLARLGGTPSAQRVRLRAWDWPLMVWRALWM